MQLTELEYVFTTKYRRPLLESQDVRLELYAIFRTLCDQEGWKLIAVKVGRCKKTGNADHVHVQLLIPPTITISYVANKLKGVSSRELRKHYHNLKQSVKRALWGVGYWYEVISDGADSETARRYIENQDCDCRNSGSLVAKRRTYKAMRSKVFAGRPHEQAIRLLLEAQKGD